MLVLAGAAALRLSVWIAYFPGLYFYDSLGYLDASNGRAFSDPSQTFGYPLLLKILSLPGQHIGVITGVQHLAGLALGILLYLLALGLGVRNWLATLAAAASLLDGYFVVIEQYVMAEAFFLLLLLISLCLVVLRGGSLPALAAGSLVYGFACVVRPAALFAVPVVLVYVGVACAGRRALLLAAVSAVLPVLVYASIHASVTGRFGLTEDSGWLLYGRIGQISSCQGLSVPASERALCLHTPVERGQHAAFYIYNLASPAVRAYGRLTTDSPARVNSQLADFAFRVIGHRPGAFVSLLMKDFARFFTPGEPSDYPFVDAPLTLPSSSVPLSGLPAQPHRWPASLVRGYVGVVHTARPVLALFALAGLVLLALPRRLRRKWSLGRRRELALFLGMALALLIGATLSHFERRYLMPAVPLLLMSGALVIEQVLHAREAERARPV